MLRLAGRDRVKAYEHFQECVEANAIGSFDYELGRAYLARMKAERNWPHWIRDEVPD